MVKTKDKQDIPSLKKAREKSVVESDPERADKLIGQLNDAFNKTENKKVTLTERSALSWIVS